LTALQELAAGQRRQLTRARRSRLAYVPAPLLPEGRTAAGVLSACPVLPPRPCLRSDSRIGGHGVEREPGGLAEPALQLLAAHLSAGCRRREPESPRLGEFAREPLLLGARGGARSSFPTSRGRVQRAELLPAAIGLRRPDSAARSYSVHDRQAGRHVFDPVGRRGDDVADGLPRADVRGGRGRNHPHVVRVGLRLI